MAPPVHGVGCIVICHCLYVCHCFVIVRYHHCLLIDCLALRFTVTINMILVLSYGYGTEERSP